MAYFSRNGFTPAHESVSKFMSMDFHSHSEKSVTAKDVKYTALRGPKNGKNLEGNDGIELEFEKVMAYARCLIKNLLYLSEYQHIERDTFLEFTATWSQFVRWHSFRRTEFQFRHYSFMKSLETKLNALAKAHNQSELIEINLSQKLTDQLNDSLDDMACFGNIKFSEIRF